MTSGITNIQMLYGVLVMTIDIYLKREIGGLKIENKSRIEAIEGA